MSASLVAGVGYTFVPLGGLIVAVFGQAHLSETAETVWAALLARE